MNKINLPDIKVLTDAINTSRDKEVYRELEKTPTYRIGVGARADSPDAPSFFLEVLIKLSAENGDVDVPRLEKTVSFLKTVQTRGYSLSYLDSTISISCEIIMSHQKISQKYAVVKSLVKTYLG